MKIIKWLPTSNLARKTTSRLRHILEVNQGYINQQCEMGRMSAAGEERALADLAPVYKEISDRVEKQKLNAIKGEITMAKKSKKKVEQKKRGPKPKAMKRVRRSSAEIDEAVEKVKQALAVAEGNNEKLSVEQACNMYGLTTQTYYRVRDRNSIATLEEKNVKFAQSEATPVLATVNREQIRDVYNNMAENLLKLSEAYDELGTTQMYPTDEVIRFLRVFKDKLVQAAQ